MKLGILDIGTNSIHLILVELRKDASIQVIDRAKEITRLGDTSFQEGYLSEGALHRGLAAIRRFKKLAEIHAVSRIKAVATSAVREAVNGGDFIETIERETGIKVDVITGEEEARLIYLAVKHSIPFGKKPSLIIDIGGGSVEAIIADENELKESWSLKLGTLRLRGEFLHHDPPTKKELQKMSSLIRETLTPVIKKCRSLGVETVVGTSGTIMNLATMAHWLDQSSPIEIQNNFRIRSRFLQELYDLLANSDRKERLKIKGIDPTRVEIIIPGSAVIKELLNELGVEDVILCDEAIREGVVYDFLARNRTKIEMEEQIPDIRLRSVMQLAKKCDFEEDHASHVTQLVLSLFDQTKTLHELGPEERELLRYASILHDIGYHINYKRHHKHTYYLIKNGDLNGFEEREIELIANIARYHCKAPPQKSHENWQRLSRDDRRVVLICSALLRLSDGLDRSHFGVIKQVICRPNGKHLTLEVMAASDPELELWAANKKKDLLEETFGKKIFFQVRSNKPAAKRTLKLIAPAKAEKNETAKKQGEVARHV